MKLSQSSQPEALPVAPLSRNPGFFGFSGIPKPLKRAVPPLVAITVMSTVLLFIRWEFSAIVAPRLLNAWLTYMAACLTFLSCTFAASMIPRVRAARSRLFWVRMGQFSSIMFCIGIAASVWILMPPASDILRFLMVLLCMWFIAMVIVLNADRASAAGAVLVVGSMAIFTLSYELPYALPLAGFLIMEGVALVMIRRQVWRAAETLEAALLLVRSERDAKTRFIASASHDLQQPLLAASLYFDHAVSYPEGPAKETAIAGARQAFTSTRALLQGMLEHLRLESGAETARMQELDLGQIVSDAVREQTVGCRAAGIDLIAVPFTQLIWSDPQLVARIISNLVTNAVQHAHGTRILIGITHLGERIRLWVIDDGCGIQEADADRIFDEYAQGSPTGAHQGGFGLGLASSKRMAALIGGTLDLDQSWTCGSAFVLQLPAAAKG